MMRLLRVILVLVVLAVLGLAGYAYFGDMAPERREVRVPVSLTGATPDAAAPAATDAAPVADAAITTEVEAPAGAADALD